MSQNMNGDLAGSSKLRTRTSKESGNGSPLVEDEASVFQIVTDTRGQLPSMTKSRSKARQVEAYNEDDHGENVGQRPGQHFEEEGEEEMPTALRKGSSKSGRRWVEYTPT